MRLSTQRRYEDLMEETYQKAFVIYVEAIREVLKKCTTLDRYYDAMGAQFFTLRNGDNVDHDALPETARLFMDQLANDFFEHWGSVGFYVTLTDIVTEW